MFRLPFIFVVRMHVVAGVVMTVLILLFSLLLLCSIGTFVFICVGGVVTAIVVIVIGLCTL